jgi:PIN domain nuclease of toxin-antitoxin system
LSKYVVDAWAWIEYLIGSESGAKVNDVLVKEGSEVYSCAITLAEVISKTAREGRDVEAAYTMLLSNSQVMNVDEELSKHAGLLHAEMRKTLKDFGLADAYVLATARRLKSKILTGDMHFKSAKDAVLIK